MVGGLAWHNLVHRRARTLAALAGVAMAILLIFLQLGFYRAAFTSTMMVFSQLRYDLVLVSPTYKVLRQPGTVPERRIVQAEGIDGVASAVALYASVAKARVAPLGLRREYLVIAVDPDESPFRLPEVNAQLASLHDLDTVLVDTKIGPGYGRLERGDAIELGGRRMRVAGSYRHGPGFAGNAAVVLSKATFRGLNPQLPAGRATIGLIRLEPGADPRTVRDALAAALPGDVLVLDASEHRRAEEEFTIEVKPVGIMFTSGVLLALIVGAVILYQILSSEVVHHLHEYATLKAMGYTAAQVRLLVLQQALLLALFGFVPAAALSALVYRIIHDTTTLPTVMTVQTLATVLALSVLMCAASGALALRKLENADPAELF